MLMRPPAAFRAPPNGNWAEDNPLSWRDFLQIWIGFYLNWPSHLAARDEDNPLPQSRDINCALGRLQGETDQLAEVPKP